MTRIRARQRLLLTLASAIGYGVGVAAVVIVVTTPSDRVLDSTAYWLAGRNVLEGRPLYGAIEIDALGAYFYPPLFAQLWAPFSLLPEPLFAWLWRGLSFACLAWLAGGVRTAGLWLLLPITLHELANPNVTLPVAAATFAALRGRGWLLPLAGMLKFGPLLIVPYLWLVRPEVRRQLVLAGLATLGVAAASLALSPQVWAEYASHLGGQSAVPSTGNGLISLAPTAAADFALRLALAAGLVVAAVATRSDRLAFVAATIATPTLWLTRLLPLLALPRLPRGRAVLAARGPRASAESAGAAQAEPI